MKHLSYSSTNRSRKIECDVLLTNKCNLSCRHCLYIERNPQKRDLSADDFNNLLAKLEGTDSEVHLLGGEPLCRQDIVDLVSEITRRGLTAKILTNGYALSKDLLLKLKEAGLKGIGVSIDGTKESHNVNRGNTLAYERVMNALDMIREFGFLPKVSCAVHSGNKDSLCPLLLELEARGVKRILIEHVLPIGHGRQLTGQNLTPDEWKSLIEEIQKFKKQKCLTISIAIQEVYSGGSNNPFSCECVSGKYPILDESGSLYPCIILYAAGASLSHISSDSIMFPYMREQIIEFISNTTTKLPQPYMLGKMQIKCPAVQLLLANNVLNLDNIKETRNVIGCFHRVIII